MDSYIVSVQKSDGTFTNEEVNPNAEPGSRSFRLSVLIGYLTEQESVELLDLIDSKPERSRKLLAAIDASFVLSIAASEIKKVELVKTDIEYALVRIGIDPDEFET